MVQYEARFKVGDVIAGTRSEGQYVRGTVLDVTEYHELMPDYTIRLPDGDEVLLDEGNSDDIVLVRSRTEVEASRQYRVKFSFNSQTHGYYYSEWFETREEALNFKMFVDQSKGVRFEDIESEEGEDV